jgi:nitrogen fixation/metabolism regulation signal transduction histidine kinase
LHGHLNRVNENFQKLKLNNEMREQYFSRILKHLSSGLLVISKTGHINQINEEALKLLNLPQLTHISALSQLYPGLHGKIRDMKSLDRAEIAVMDRETGLKTVLGLQVVEINLGGEDVRIATLHDLSAGMERKEIDDWIRLIRVMSHEIMNSLAPITSISTTLKEVWADHVSKPDGGIPTEATIQQTLKGLDAIAEQSEGLTAFFESYRVLSRIPDPVKKEFTVCGIFEKLETLVSHYKEDGRLRILFEYKYPDLKIYADEQMITQVLLNLVKNAVQAVERIEKAEIIVSAFSHENRIVLKVTDNGEGIPSEISDEIFMPFFTTRKKGTGVGLSYSRQVMAMNSGRIEFDSQPGRTQFRLLF